jgi:hypothetical protein
MKMNQIKWMRSLGNASYILGVAFLIASLLTSVLPPGVVSANQPKSKLACEPTNTPTNTPVPPTNTPTNTPVPPTDTPTNTPVPPTDTPTNTPLPPTDTPTNTPLPPTDTPTNTPLPPTDTPTNTPVTPPDYLLNLSHIACVDGKVEIHFVLLNIPDGLTPGTLTYTYGSISPSKHTGNVWHYFDYKPDGFYNVTSASVSVGGTIVSLHNPGTDSGTYNCSPTNTPVTPTKTPTSTPTETSTETPTPSTTHTPTSTSTGTVTETYTPTITATSTATNTSTPTETPTNTATITPPFHDPFSLEFYCTGFTVINKNDFVASYEWSIGGGPSGTGVVEPFGSVSYDTEYYPGLVSLYSGGQLMAAGYLPTDCGKKDKTPTPPVRTPRTPAPSRTPHDPTKVVKTLIPPVTTPDILIPVTGVDLAGGNSLPRMLFSLGLGLLGLGFVMNGMARRRTDLDL